MINGQYDLAWKTYEFHTQKVHEIESKYQSMLDLYYRFVGNNLNPSQIKKNYIRTKINKFLSTMISAYNKQINSIDDLIIAYDKELDAEFQKDVDTELLNHLKNTTATLIEEIKVLRNEINQVLG